jgi:hypothetical protein
MKLTSVAPSGTERVSEPDGLESGVVGDESFENSPTEKLKAHGALSSNVATAGATDATTDTDARTPNRGFLVGSTDSDADISKLNSR